MDGAEASHNNTSCRKHNYRAQRRAIEIGLSTKRKLGFIKGTIIRSTTDKNLAKLWDTCNNMVIWWIMGYVSESIARPIMFVGTASEIWKHLEKKFLNRLEEHFSHQRSQILMIDPLPIVETTCSLLQQEESQTLLFKSSDGIESTTLLSKGVAKDMCSICGFKWHPPEKCQEKVGYPLWHAKFKGSQQEVRRTCEGAGRLAGKDSSIATVFETEEEGNGLGVLARLVPEVRKDLH
uniref:Uncharacterized protein n=1 Tax=Tanacetum cinerariifolium TaxID=118510 RepID=A0A699HGT0_TANCI|nr:hypothetical protein [Tanacetum cinerariifolium]